MGRSPLGDPVAIPRDNLNYHNGIDSSLDFWVVWLLSLELTSGEAPNTNLYRDNLEKDVCLYIGVSGEPARKLVVLVCTKFGEHTL